MNEFPLLSKWVTEKSKYLLNFIERHNWNLFLFQSLSVPSSIGPYSILFAQNGNQFHTQSSVTEFKWLEEVSPPPKKKKKDTINHLNWEKTKEMIQT